MRATSTSILLHNHTVKVNKIGQSVRNPCSIIIINPFFLYFSLLTLQKPKLCWKNSTPRKRNATGDSNPNREEGKEKDLIFVWGWSHREKNPQMRIRMDDHKTRPLSGRIKWKIGKGGAMVKRGFSFLSLRFSLCNSLLFLAVFFWLLCTRDERGDTVEKKRVENYKREGIFFSLTFPSSHYNLEFFFIILWIFVFQKSYWTFHPTYTGSGYI